MKIKILFSIIAISLLIAGCGNTTQISSQPLAKIQTSFELIGSSTLANSTICIDTNENRSCDENEVTALSDKNGFFILQTDSKITDNRAILSTSGYNLLLREANDAGMKLMALYHDSNQQFNITTLTTLVALSVEKGEVYSNALKNVANRYDLTTQLIEENPLISILEKDKQMHFLTISAMEEYFLHIDIQEGNTSRKSGGLDLGFISYDQADSALNYFDIFSTNVQQSFYYTLIMGNSYFHELLEFIGINETPKS